ncbi:MAG TPA: ATP synthase F1 subunit gamma [Cytophagales bacterium]|nr:ATP synthase F1 subunit gamma [Cytophagales bacterium]HCR53196.1 ATP synthase F1 subunit gamma [Cytophagales bacterium]
MASLKEVKSRISSIISTQQITKAMKMVAAAKLRKSQERIIQMRPFSQKLSEVLRSVSGANEEAQNWYNEVREEKNILIVTVSADRGLCGSFNSTVFKATLKLIKDKYEQQQIQGTVTILPIGKKALEYFKKRGFKVEDAYSTMFQDISFDNVSRAAEHMMNGFKSGKYDKIEIVFNEFKNVATQILRVEPYLPILSVDGDSGTTDADYIYQPNREEIVTGLIPKSLKVQLFKAVLDSNAAENGARMTAMDKATENAGELLKELKLTYNRTRQAAITKEILEIVGGAEALKSS